MTAALNAPARGTSAGRDGGTMVAAGDGGGGALVGHLAQLFSVTAWASGLVVLKPLTEAFDLRLVVLVQMGAGALIIWPIVLALAGWRPGPGPGGVAKRLAFGAITPGCAMLLNAAGAARTDAVSLGVMWGLLPLMVPLLGRAFIGERVSGVLYLGAAVAFGGIVALVGQRQGDAAAGADLAGNLLVFAAVLCSSFGQVLGRYLNRDAGQRPMVTAALQVTGAALVAALAAAVTLPFAAGPMIAGGSAAPPARAVAELGWLVLIPTVANLLAYNVALSRLPVGWVSLYVSLVPGVSAGLAALYLGEVVHAWEAGAIAVIVAGVALPSADRAWRTRRPGGREGAKPAAAGR